MAEVIKMPRFGDATIEGEVIKWNKKIGDMVKIGDVLAEIETDKANMELESFHNGMLLHIGAEIGQAISIGSLLCIIGN